MGSIADRLDLVIKNLGIGERELARRAELASESHIGLIRKRLREDPGAVMVGTLEKIARGAGVSLAWLVTGEEAGPRPDRAPARASAAAAAQSRGVWAEAIRSVLAEDVKPEDLDRTAVWWLSRMMMREEEMIDEALRRRSARAAEPAAPSFWPKAPEEHEREPPDESGEGRIKRKPKAAGRR